MQPRMFSLLVAAALATTFTACNNSGKGDKDKSADTPMTTTPTDNPPAKEEGVMVGGAMMVRQRTLLTMRWDLLIILR